MSEGTRKPSRELVPIEDPSEGRRLIKEGIRTTASAMFWVRNQDDVTHSHLSAIARNETAFQAHRPKDLNMPAFLAELQASGSKDCYFSVSLLSSNIFYKSRFIGFDSKALNFAFPEKVFKVQRRQELRFTVPAQDKLMVEFEDPHSAGERLKRRIWDISASGLAFVGASDDELTLKSGLTLKNLSFTLNGRKILCSGEIRHSFPLPKSELGPGMKLGVRFLNIRPGDSQHIASYVFEENRKTFSRVVE